MRLLTLLSILVLFLGCASPHKIEHKTGEKTAALATPSESETSEELDICEAVFRHVFEHNASGQQQNANAYFLKIFGKDPTEAFLARFQEHRPPVKMGSAFVTGNGLEFRIESIDRIHDNKVEVRGGYFEGGLSSSGNIYTVVRKGQQWQVIDDRMLWIS